MQLDSVLVTGIGRTQTCTQRVDHVRTQRGDGPLHVKEKGLRRNQHCCHLMSNFQPLELWENAFLLCELPRLWHLVTPAQWHSHRTALLLVSNMFLPDFDLYILYLISSSLYPLMFIIHFTLQIRKLSHAEGNSTRLLPSLTGPEPREHLTCISQLCRQLLPVWHSMGRRSQHSSASKLISDAPSLLMISFSLIHHFLIFSVYMLSFLSFQLVKRFIAL